MAGDETVWFGIHPKHSIVKAGAWAGAANFGSALLSLAGTIILSRMLTPADIGLFSVAFTFYSIPSMVIGPGLTAAAVQAPNLTPQQSSNLLWINVAVNAALALILVAVAPALAEWYHQPALRMLCNAFAFVLVLEGFATQYRALLTRAMRFDIAAKIGIAVGSASLVVAVVLAWFGLGAWALAMQAIVGAVADRIALATVVSWRPSWFDRRTSVKDVLHFSAGSSLTLAMHMLYTQSQSLLMGRCGSVSDVGFYGRGQALFQKPFSQVIGPLHAVLLPALSARQRDPDHLGTAVYRANAVLYTLLPPVTIWMMISGSDIAGTLLGRGWEPAGQALFWFALAAIPGILFGTLYKSNDAIGRPAWGLGIRALFLPMLLAGLVWAAPRGAAAMAAVGAAVEWASAPVILWLLLKESPVPHRFYVQAMGECIATISLTMLAMWPMQALLEQLGLPVMARASLSLIGCFVAALLIARLFPFGRTAWLEGAALARRRFQRTGMKPA
jgi:PST family polysaccharide transporter